MFEKDLDVSYLNELGRTLISSQVVLLAEDGGEKKGMIAGLVAPNLYNPKYTVLQELFWWVVEEHRGTSVAIRLFSAFEEKARELKVDAIVMATTSHSPSLPTIYKKRGYVLMEQSFIKEL
jgi:N-acetylglutamate synthase-like GNAT family acetyltransferase